MSDKEQINWRTVGVKRDRKYEELISRLNSGDRSIFQYIKDIMVFAAMVGYSEGAREPISGDTIDIILETYSSDEKDGFIYLLALIETQDGACLKDSNLHSSVRIFEEYCNAGLAIINNWLDQNPSDVGGVDTILEKVYERICLNEEEEIPSNEEIEIEV